MMVSPCMVHEQWMMVYVVSLCVSVFAVDDGVCGVPVCKCICCG